MSESTEKDRQLLIKKGITKAMLDAQATQFKQGVPPTQLYKAAVIDDNILPLPKEEVAKYVAIYQHRKKGNTILKFVPVSGAATCMFKSLFASRDAFEPDCESFTTYVNHIGNKEIHTFFNSLERFAFYPLLKACIDKHHPDFVSLNKDVQKHIIVSSLLSEEGLSYDNMPKGLLPFHRHSEKIAIPFEEHFHEAVFYASDDKEADLHFTITEQHTEAFYRELNLIKPVLRERYGIRFNVSFSYQKPGTDTVSVAEDNEYFRDEDGNLLFRPAGHEALLNDLNDIDVDIIFIKDIDSIVMRKHADETVFYKEALAGKLCGTQDEVFRILHLIDNNEVKGREVKHILSSLKEININVLDYLRRLRRQYALEFIKKQLHRPIRVCGMVKNEDEPGGDPFWIKEADSGYSLRIIESA